MWVGIGVGIGRNRFATGIFNAYALRVTADGGITEAGQCVDAVTGLLLNASLLLIPSGYKGGKLYAEIPTNGNGDLTWTRGGDAWRTNASGVLQRVPWNLLQQSQTFDNATWIPSDVSVSANATTAPDGTLTADKLVENSVNTAHNLVQAVSTNSGNYTFSIYAKASERNFIVLYNLTAVIAQCFDLSNGTIGASTGSPSSTITNVGNGWYRCTMTHIATTANNSFRIYLATSNTVSVAYQGNGTSGLFIWGAQLVEGTTAQTYLPTTDRLNFPRLSYMYGSCPALLLEPQRTNLALHSSAVGGTGWTMAFAGVGVTPTVTTNYAVAPDGTTSASRLQLSLGGGTTTLDQSLVTQTITGTSCRGSFYIKTNDGSTKTIYMRGSSASSVVIDGTWKRYDFDAATLSTTQFGIGLRGGQTPTNSNTADILVWGAQLEPNAAYPTTHIPTTSATATRVADSFSRNNIYTNGLITSAGGTWFVELRNNVSYTRDTFTLTPLIIGDNATSPNNGLMLRNSGGSSMRLEIRKLIAGSTTLLYTTLTDTIKIAFKWNGSSVDVFVNGTKQVSASFFATTNMDFLVGSGVDVPKFIQQMALFPTPLSDTDCTTLTTL